MRKRRQNRLSNLPKATGNKWWRLIPSSLARCCAQNHYITLRATFRKQSKCITSIFSILMELNVQTSNRPHTSQSILTLVISWQIGKVLPRHVSMMGIAINTDIKPPRLPSCLLRAQVTGSLPYIMISASPLNYYQNLSQLILN